MKSTARIALLQLPAFGVEDAEASLAHTLRRIDDAAREQPDIIALPEVTYPAYFIGGRDLPDGVRSPGEVMDIFAAKANEHGVYIAAGMAVACGDAPQVAAWPAVQTIERRAGSACALQQIEERRRVVEVGHPCGRRQVEGMLLHVAVVDLGIDLRDVTKSGQRARLRSTLQRAGEYADERKSPQPLAE